MHNGRKSKHILFLLGLHISLQAWWPPAKNLKVDPCVRIVVIKVGPGFFEHLLQWGERNRFFPNQPLKVSEPHLFWPEGCHQDEKKLVGLSKLLEDLLEDLLEREGVSKYPFPAHGWSIGEDCSVVWSLWQKGYTLGVQPCGKQVKVGMTPLLKDKDDYVLVKWPLWGKDLSGSGRSSDLGWTWPKWKCCEWLSTRTKTLSPSRGTRTESPTLCWCRQQQWSCWMLLEHTMWQECWSERGCEWLSTRTKTPSPSRGTRTESPTLCWFRQQQWSCWMLLEHAMWQKCQSERGVVYTQIWQGICSVICESCFTTVNQLRCTVVNPVSQLWILFHNCRGRN